MALSTFSYIEIPLLLKHSLSVPFARPFILIGPSIAFLISAKYVKTSLLLSPGEEFTYDIKSGMSGTDIGAVAGAGLTIPLTPIDITLDTRYAYSLTHIGKSDDAANICSRVLAIYAGIEF